MSLTSAESCNSTRAYHLHPDFSPIPPELWLHIFPHVPLADLHAVSLTCSSFRYMAQPLLFSVLDISPFFLAYSTERPILRPVQYLDWTKARLKRFLLPHIAPAVKHCWISPYSRVGFPPRNHRDDLDPHLVIDAVIESLSLFPNLTSLSWHCVDITPKWWSIIQSLPVTKLWLNSCAILGNDPAPLPSVAHLDLDQWPWEGQVTNHVSIHEERFAGVDRHFLPLIIRPEVIQSISVPRPDTAQRLLFALADMSTQIRVLRIPFAAMASTAFIPALIQCTALEELRILPPTDHHPRDITLESIPPSALPELSLYEGPYTHLLEFSHHPLKGIVLWGLDEHPALCNPEKLLDVVAFLARTKVRQTLELFQISITRVTTELMNCFASFPNLISVAVESHDGPPDEAYYLGLPSPSTEATEIKHHSPVTVLYILLRDVHLPGNLQHLRMTTRLTSGNIDIKTQEQEAARFAEHLALKHSELRIVELAYGEYWTGMFSTEWNRVKRTEGEDEGAELNFEAEENQYHSEVQEVKGSIIIKSRVLPLNIGTLTFTEHQRMNQQPDALCQNEWEPGHFVVRSWSYLLLWLRLKQIVMKYFPSS